MHEVDVDRTIGAFYDALLEPGPAAAALEHVSRLFGASGVAYWHNDARTGAILSFCQRGYDDAAQAAYTAHFHAIDPGMAILAGGSAGQWLTGPDVLDPKHPGNAEYVHDFCGPNDIRWVGGGRVEQNAEFVSFMTLQRPHGRGSFDEHQAALFGRLAPHLRRHALLERRMARLEQRADGLEAVAGRLAHTLLVVDDRLVIHYCNRAGEQQAGGMVMANSTFLGRRSLSPAEYARLTRAVGDAVALPDGMRRGAVLRLSPCGRGPVTVAVVPLSPAHRWLTHWQLPMAMILIESEPKPAPDERVARLHGLTPAELSVVRGLAAGKTLREVAQAREVAEETVRSHVKSVMSKLQVRRQAEVVRWAQAFAAFDLEP